MPRINPCLTCGHGASWHTGSPRGRKGCFFPAIGHGNCPSKCLKYLPTFPPVTRPKKGPTFNVESIEAKAFYRCKRALAPLMHKNHDLDSEHCAGCLEVVGFLTMPGYRGDLVNPVGSSFEVPL